MLPSTPPIADAGESTTPGIVVEMPAVKDSTSKLSGRYQARAKWIVGAGVFMAGIYALAGPLEPFHWTINIAQFPVNVVALGASVAFLAAFILHICRLIFRPDSKWYSSRGLTEEIKSFAWRYAVGGAPFSKSKLTPGEANDRFGDTLQVFLRKSLQEKLSLPIPEASSTLSYITDSMADARAASLDERRGIYAEQRIQHQQDYYASHTSNYRRVANRWSAGLVIFEGVFALLAGAHAVGLITLNFFGVVGTIAAAITAWIQFNQYRALADLYSIMAFELGGFYRKCLRPAHPWDEEHWTDFVDTVENFLEAEHGAWRKLVDPDRTDTQFV